jgi:hypothetical protein
MVRRTVSFDGTRFLSKIAAGTIYRVLHPDVSISISAE